MDLKHTKDKIFIRTKSGTNRFIIEYYTFKLGTAL